MKKSKLKIEKFRILELTNPSNIRGGTDSDPTTDTMGSDNTTYTTDPDVQCPLTTVDPLDPTKNTRTTISGGSGVPTFGP